MSHLRPVAIIATSMGRICSADVATPIEDAVFAVARDAVATSGLAREQIGLTVSASSDMLEGRPFNFVKGLEALGAHPAIHQRHVEMDAAWAVYEAWIAMQAGEFDSALVVGWGKTSEANLRAVTNTQLEPFVLAPLGLDHVWTAGLEAAATSIGRDELDAIAARARAAAAANPRVGDIDEAPDRLLADPLWQRHFARNADGACAIVLATGEAVPPGRHAWIRGADHRTASGSLGHRDPIDVSSARLAFDRAATHAGWRDVDVAELSAIAAHQIPLLSSAFDLSAGTAVDPSGGALGANPMIATGAVRIAEAALQVTGRADAVQVKGARRALAHAAAGHALQQNAVFLIEGDA